MKSINALHRGSFFDKTEVVIYILALFTFVLLILTFTRDKKKHLFQDRDLVKTHLLKSQYLLSHKSNSEFIEDLSNAVSENNKDLIPSQPVMYRVTKSENKNNDEHSGLLEKPLAPQKEKVTSPAHEESLSLKSNRNNSQLESPSTDRTNIQSTKQSMNEETKKDAVIEVIIKNQPENKMPSESTEIKIQPEQSIHHYRVKKGDCMSFIANKFKISLKALLRQNPMKNPNLIYIGSIINIPKSK
ncbi:MAG: hypothetical protein IEMM0008_1713 [bacterium]|nr:MAG: hypothetical protein IEMM0008_1713 [bacterium]